MVDGEDEESYAKIVDDDDVIDDKVEEKNDDKEEKKDDNDDDDDNNYHALVRGKVLGSLKTRKEKMQTPNDLSSNKTLSKDLTVNVSPTPDTTSKDLSMSQPTSSTC
nr:hypothetical protein [Tanacetum cinerariifolium]